MSAQQIDFGKVMQGSRPTLSFIWPLPTSHTPTNWTGVPVTGVLAHTVTGEVYAITGTFAVVAGVTRSLTWALSEEDSGTAGEYQVVLLATVGGLPIYTLYGSLVVEENPSVNAVHGPMLVGISATLAAWVAAAAAAVPDGGDVMPVVDPAVAGDLVIQAADGTLTGAGYAADVDATAGSVVRRANDGSMSNYTSGSQPFSISGESDLFVGTEGRSRLGSGGLSVSSQGSHHHEFGAVSAIARATGALVFLGADAATNRAAMRNEIEALPIDANVTTPRTSGYTFQTTDRGAVIPVSGTFTFSLPDGMPVGAQAVLVRTGAGTVTLAAATTLVSDGTQMTTNGAVTVIHLGSNVWYAFGKLS